MLQKPSEQISRHINFVYLASVTDHSRSICMQSTSFGWDAVFGFALPTLKPLHH